jgi:hypothetical protein
MIFIETAVFTRRVLELLDDEAYAKLQISLAAEPRQGAVIEGTGGMRKLRVAANQHGKRGGARVIYYHVADDAQVFLLLIYTKNDQVDLTNDQRKALKAFVETRR